jgi:chorismate dehydratase
MQRARIATVPYVNAAPLVWGFRHGRGAILCDVVAALPAHIPDLLLSGAVDAGLVPVIEAPRLEAAGITLLTTVGIASRRAARSVLLIARRPIERVRRVALDRSSRTSAALLRIVMAHRHAGPVAYEEADPDLDAMLAHHDAALLIGDPALAADTRGLHVYDLATEWHVLTGLPFVFAGWAVRPGTGLPGGDWVFEDSLREGLPHLDAIAAEAAGAMGMSAREVAAYLRDNIHYELGHEDRRAIEQFFARASDLGLIAPRRPSQARPTGEPPAARPARIPT